MGGKKVRGKKSRRSATIKITRGARKKTKRLVVGDSVLQKHWNKAKTIQSNMMELGLSYDSNTTLAGNKSKKLKRKNRNNVDVMEVEETTVRNDSVIKEFERQAANGKKVERHIPPGEAKFLLELLKKHDTNYKAMARDKLNMYQHTSKQLQHKCQAFLKSSSLTKYQEMYPELAFSTDEMDLT